MILIDANRSDIVVANSDTNNLVIYSAWRNGSFGAEAMFSIGINSYPQYVITGDINKDKYFKI